MTKQINDFFNIRKQKKAKKKKFIILWLFFLLLAVGVIAWFAWQYSHAYTMKHKINFSSNWHYYQQNQQKTMKNLHSYVFIEPNQSITIAKTLPLQLPKEAYLLVQSYNQQAKVYVNNTLLYQNWPQISDKKQGMEVTLLPLPEEAGGKTVSVCVQSPYDVYSYSPEPIYLGDVGSLYTFIWASSLPSIIMAAFTVSSGLLFFVFSAYIGIQKNILLEKNLAFGLFSILLAPFFLSDSLAFFQVFSPSISAFLWNVSWYAFQVPLLIFISNHFKIYQKSSRVLISIYTFILCLLLILDRSSTIVFAQSLLFGNRAASIMLLVMLVFFYVEFRHKNQFMRMLTPIVILFILVACLYNFDDTGQFFQIKQILLRLNFILFIIIVWIYQVKLYWEKQRTKEKTSYLLAIKNHHLLEQIHQMKTMEYEIHKMNHEIHHHLSAFRILFEAKDYVAMRDYLDKITPVFHLEQKRRYTNNPLIDVIISQMMYLSQKARIMFSASVNISDELNLPEPELVSLLMNILENAMEGAQKVAPAWIDFQMMQKKDFIVIVCRNAYQADALQFHEGRLQSSKADAKNHGYGLLAIKEATKKMNGTLHITYDSIAFQVKAVLRLPIKNE